MHQVLEVSVPAGDWGGQDTARTEADVERRPEHGHDRLGSERGVAHDPFADAATPHLELRLDEQHEVGIVDGGRREARAAPW